MENSKTTFRPILFSTPMVQAILDGRKTQTRRTKGLESINEMPENYKYIGLSTDDDDYKGCHYFEYINYKYPPETYNPVEPVMNVGDVLWVRETFYKTIAEELKGAFFYKADIDKLSWTFKWKPSIFMPKEACRIFLKIKSIRVERLKSITREDARSEGIERDLISGTKFKNYVDDSTTYNEQTSFFSLWESINGKQSLEANPYVFAY